MGHTTHGGFGTTEYIAYRNMLSRCLNPKHPRYRQYGARGVTICARWIESFGNFVADMGRKPSPDLTLDRIDPTGNYEPANCRWISFDANRRNRRARKPHGKKIYPPIVLPNQSEANAMNSEGCG